MIDSPAFAAAWLRQRMAGAAAVAAVEVAELAALDAATALAAADALLAAAPIAAMSAARVSTSGFVEQQRLFSRARLLR
jgi:hypothetical protein